MTRDIPASTEARAQLTGLVYKGRCKPFFHNHTTDLSAAAHSPDMFRVFALSVLAVVCYAVPDGFILDIQHSCGTLQTQGSITIKSDLHVKARIKCNDSSLVQMPDIDETTFQSTTNLYYTSAGAGDCVFANPTTNSSLYTVELEVGWGFKNTSMMDELKTYTISCTSGDTGSDDLVGSIDDAFVPLTEDIEHLGGNFTGTTTVRLVDILGNEITGDLPMGKKMYLEVSVSGGSAAGLTPYSCTASNGANSYSLLTAGCGDGSVFPRDVGFTTDGLTAKSPMFRAFRVATPAGDASGVTFTCEVTTCSDACDGTSCALRKKRDVSPKDGLVAQSRKYLVRPKSEDDRLDARLRSSRLENKLRLTEFEVMGVAIVSFLSLFIAVYACIRSEKRRKERESRIVVIDEKERKIIPA